MKKERKHRCPHCGSVQRGCNLAKHLRKYHGVIARNQIDKRLIYDLYDAHLSQHAIVKQLDLTKEVVREVLHDRNERAAFRIAIREPTSARRVVRYLDAIEELRPGTVYSTVRLPDREIARTIHLYVNERLSLTEVGRILGIKGHTVWWRLKQAGVPTRSRSESISMARKRRTHDIADAHTGSDGAAGRTGAR